MNTNRGASAPRKGNTMSEYVREISHLDPDYLNYVKQCDAVCLKIFSVCTIEEAFEYYWSGDMSDGMVDHFYHTIQQLKRQERKA